MTNGQLRCVPVSSCRDCPNCGESSVRTAHGVQGVLVCWVALSEAEQLCGVPESINSHGVLSPRIKREALPADPPAWCQLPFFEGSNGGQ